MTDSRAGLDIPCNRPWQRQPHHGVLDGRDRPRVVFPARPPRRREELPVGGAGRGRRRLVRQLLDRPQPLSPRLRSCRRGSAPYPASSHGSPRPHLPPPGFLRRGVAAARGRGTAAGLRRERAALPERATGLHPRCDVDPTDARNDILGCFGRSDRSAQVTVTCPPRERVERAYASLMATGIRGGLGVGNRRKATPIADPPY
jgi:hypothetical protein